MNTASQPKVFTTEKPSFATPAKAKKPQNKKADTTAASSAFTDMNTEASLKSAASASNLKGQHRSAKGSYSGKGTYSNGRPRNFYNPPHKVLKQLQQAQLEAQVGSNNLN